MKFANLLLALGLFVIIFASSCTSMSRSMRTPNHHIEFKKEDFEFSAAVTGEAKQVKVLGIDWQRLFKKSQGDDRESLGAISLESALSQVPVVGGFLGNQSLLEKYALHDLMEKNQGYDVVFFPQYETKTKSFLFFFSKSTIKVTARLGKLK